MNLKEGIDLPIVFGEKRKQGIEEAFREEWEFTTAEMVKRDGKWRAHFVLKKTVEAIDEPETAIAIDRGKKLRCGSRYFKNNLNKPMKGQFRRGSGVKRLRGLTATSVESLEKRNFLRRLRRSAKEGV